MDTGELVKILAFITVVLILAIGGRRMQGGHSPAAGRPRDSERPAEKL
jgi:hypothetical protein